MTALCLRYNDFIYLSENELLEILKQRNSDYVRRFMDNDRLISVEDHLSFCRSLSTRTDLKYFYVTLNHEPFGIVDFKAETPDWSSAVGGKYTFGDQNLPMEKVYTTALLWLMEQVGLKTVHAHVKNDNIKALLPVYFKPTPGMRIIKKDEHYTYHETTLEPEPIRAYVTRFIQNHDLTIYFNQERWDVAGT